MIIKSFEIKKKLENFLNFNFYLLYGENSGLKKDIRDLIKTSLKKKVDDTEILSFYENELLNDEENFYNDIYSGSLFGNKKIIIIYEATDKIIKKISDVYEKYPENVTIIIFSGALEKKSKLRNFFEKGKNTICIPCYLDNERDLETIIQSELRNKNVVLSRESINLLIEKSNSDRDNLRREIEKIKSYALNKNKIETDEIKSLINFSGEYKSDVLINACLCGNLLQYKKTILELYSGTVSQILLLRNLSYKIHRLLKIKTQTMKSNNIDETINATKPMIFWQEKPLVKKQLSIWNIVELKKIIFKINEVELLCKTKPQVSKVIFFNFFLEVFIKANNSS